MKRSVILALVGIAAVVAVAGAAVASGVGADVLSSKDKQCKGTGDKTSESGNAHQWMHQYMWMYMNSTGICPLDYYWNYSWDYDYGSSQ